MIRSDVLTEDLRSGLKDLLRRWLWALALGCAMAAQANGQVNGQVNGNHRQLITKEMLEPVLHRHAQQYGAWALDNIDLRVGSFPPVALAPGTLRLRVLQPDKAMGPGAQNFLVAAEIDGKEESRFWVKSEIRIFDQVVVATVPIARQEVVKPKDVRLERREIAGRGSRPFTRIDDVVGKQSIRAIEINEAITSSLVDRPTLLKRGSTITLVFDSGALRVETTGIAEENGKMGDLIQVKNPSSGKTLRGTVIDGRNVRVN